MHLAHIFELSSATPFTRTGNKRNQRYPPFRLIWSEKALGLLKTNLLDYRPVIQCLRFPTIRHQSSQKFIRFTRNH